MSLKEVFKTISDIIVIFGSVFIVLTIAYVFIAFAWLDNNGIIGDYIVWYRDILRNYPKYVSFGTISTMYVLLTVFKSEN